MAQDDDDDRPATARDWYERQANPYAGYGEDQWLSADRVPPSEDTEGTPWSREDRLAYGWYVPPEPLKNYGIPGEVPLPRGDEMQYEGEEGTIGSRPFPEEYRPRGNVLGPMGYAGANDPTQQAGYQMPQFGALGYPAQRPSRAMRDIPNQQMLQPTDPGFNPEAMPGQQGQGLTGQALWDRIGKEMDSFQEHAHPNYRAKKDEPDTLPEGDRPTGYFGGGFGVPPLRMGDDGKAYLADREGNVLTAGGHPVSLESYHRHVMAATASEDPIEQWRHAQDHEAAAFNSSLSRMLDQGFTPQQMDMVQGMVDGRQKQLQQLMLQIHNDPNLDAHTRAVTAGHIYRQMGNLAQHVQAAQQKKAELQTPLNQGERMRLNRLHQAASWMDDAISNGTLNANDPSVQETRRDIMGRVGMMTARDQTQQQMNQQKSYQQQEQSVHHIQGPDGQMHMVAFDSKGTPHWAPKSGAAQKEQGWEGMPVDKKHALIAKHAQDYGISFEQAAQEVQQHMQMLSPQSQQQGQAPTQDHPQLGAFLSGQAAVNPAEIARQLTPETAKRMKNIANAGADWIGDPMVQQQAKKLFPATPAGTGAPPPKRMTQKQINDQQAHELKVKQDAEAHAAKLKQQAEEHQKKAEEAFTKHGLDLRHRAVEELHKEWSMKEGAGQDAHHVNPMPTDDDEREQQIQQRRMKLDPGHVEEELARKYLGPGNRQQQGPPKPASQPQTPQQPPQGAPQTGHLSKPWFDEMAQKAGMDEHAPRASQFPVNAAEAALAMPQVRGAAPKQRAVLGALEGMVQRHGTGPGTLMSMPTKERYLFLRLLQEAKSIDPTLPNIDLGDFGLDEQGTPIPRKGASPF
jgi:hypothetical protein